MRVATVNHFHGSEMTLTLGAFFGQDVILERLRALELPGPRLLEALCGASIRFQLRHSDTLFSSLTHITL